LSWRGKIRVAPRAKRAAWGGRRGGRIVIRVIAPPADGKANAELGFLAAEFAVPLQAVTIERGTTSRDKTVRIDEPNRLPEEVARLDDAP
jgi:uncharacterized protein (TIGR00251 family)